MKQNLSHPQRSTMDALSVNRQKIIKVIENLPNEALLELASFVEYLHYKATRRISVSEPKVEENPGSAFLLSIAGLGASAEDDVSERDEDILATEIEPVYGWSVKPDKKA